MPVYFITAVASAGVITPTIVQVAAVLLLVLKTLSTLPVDKETPVALVLLTIIFERPAIGAVQVPAILTFCVATPENSRMV